MPNDTTNTAGPTITESGHLAGFGSTQTTEQTTEQRTNEPAVSPSDTTLTVDANTAGLDEPPPSMRDKSELDDWGGAAPESNTEEDQSSGTNPQSSTSEHLLPDGFDWAPDDSDTDNDGRTGLLSTRIEVHALVLGIAAGTFVAQTGRFDEIAAIIGAGAGSSRAQLGLPDKYLTQAKKELPYFIGGVLIGFAGSRYGALAGIGV